MRIAIDARFIGASSYGLAQYSENLVTALSQIDTVNEYTVFIGAKIKRRLKVGQNFRVRPIKGLPLSGKGLARMSLALRRSEFDLVHVHFPLAPVAADFPTLITVHDVVPFQRAAGRSAFAPTFWDRVGGLILYPMTMRRAQWILCVSHATRQQLCEIFPDVFHKTIVVASGVEDIYRERPNLELVMTTQSRLRLPKSFVFYSGSAAASKNVPGMIAAFAEARRSDERLADTHFILDIMGDHKGMNAVRQAIAQFHLQDRVGVHSDLSLEERRVAFDRARALFLASRDEGFGFPAIRAQLCGVPVVAADSGALPEVCGEGAILVDPDNQGEMATMLARALFDDDLREYLKERGAKNAERFSWAGTARHVKQIYELLF